jgi:transposase
MLHLSASRNYFLYSGHTDMRKGFDSLSGIVKSQRALNTLNGSVFIFMNRRLTHIKLLL